MKLKNITKIYRKIKEYTTIFSLLMILYRQGNMYITVNNLKIFEEYYAKRKNYTRTRRIKKWQ